MHDYIHRAVWFGRATLPSTNGIVNAQLHKILFQKSVYSLTLLMSLPAAAVAEEGWGWGV